MRMQRPGSAGDRWSTPGVINMVIVAMLWIRTPRAEDEVEPALASTASAAGP